MVTLGQARALALGFPEAVEADHHGRPSFRVRGKIFATVWSPSELNVMAGDGRILAACSEAVDACSPVYWGRRLAAVRVSLPAASLGLVEALLADAWARRAPRSLVSER